MPGGHVRQTRELVILGYLAIGSGLAALVIWFGWHERVAILEPLGAVAVGWFVLVLPLYDRHRWPAKVFLIVTALAVIGHIWVVSTPLDCSGRSEDWCLYASMARAFDDAAILICWLVGGAILAIIRFLMLVLDSIAPRPQKGAA